MSELPQILNQTCIHFNLFTHELELYKIKILMQEIISRSQKITRKLAVALFCNCRGTRHREGRGSVAYGKKGKEPKAKGT